MGLSNWLSVKQSKILFLGLDNSGKSSILFKLLKESFTPTTTLSFNNRQYQYKNVNFDVFDLGSQSKVMELWNMYFADVQAIVFVVESNNVGRFAQASQVLSQVMNDPLLDTKCKLLVLGNKSDLPGAVDENTLIHNLQLNNITQEWHVKCCSSITGIGVSEGFDWLVNKL